MKMQVGVEAWREKVGKTGGRRRQEQGLDLRKGSFLMWRKHSPNNGGKHKMSGGKLARKSPFKPRHVPESGNPGSLAHRDLQCFLFSIFGFNSKVLGSGNQTTKHTGGKLVRKLRWSIEMSHLKSLPEKQRRTG